MMAGITFLEELRRMKKEIEPSLGEIFTEDSAKGEEVSQWVEKLPKFEGTKRTPKSRARKVINPL